MVDINTITLSGSVTGEVDVSKKADVSVARFQLAQVAADEATPPTRFKVVAFGDNAVFCQENLNDGDAVVVMGRLAIRQWGKRLETEVQARSIIKTGKKEKKGTSTSATDSG